MVLLDMLEDLAFLQGMAPEHLRRVAAIGQLQEELPDTILFHEGQDAHAVYLVFRGEVALEAQLPGDGMVSLQTIGPGELLGWSPVLGLGPMTATARTLTRCRLIALNVQQTLNLCRDEPCFGVEFLRRTAVALAKRLTATRLQLAKFSRATSGPHP